MHIRKGMLRQWLAMNPKNMLIVNIYICTAITAGYKIIIRE